MESPASPGGFSLGKLPAPLSLAINIELFSWRGFPFRFFSAAAPACCFNNLFLKAAPPTHGS